jgi:hypothetical protein
VQNQKEEKLSTCVIKKDLLATNSFCSTSSCIVLHFVVLQFEIKMLSVSLNGDIRMKIENISAAYASRDGKENYIGVYNLKPNYSFYFHDLQDVRLFVFPDGGVRCGHEDDQLSDSITVLSNIIGEKISQVSNHEISVVPLNIVNGSHGHEIRLKLRKAWGRVGEFINPFRFNDNKTAQKFAGGGKMLGSTLRIDQLKPILQQHFLQAQVCFSVKQLIRTKANKVTLIGELISVRVKRLGLPFGMDIPIPEGWIDSSDAVNKETEDNEETDEEETDVDDDYEPPKKSRSAPRKTFSIRRK